MSEPLEAGKSKSKVRGATRELGRKFREALKEKHSHQYGVCAKLGIPWRTHTWRMAQDAEPGSELEGYQLEVMAGLDEQRRLDLDDMESAVKDAPGSHATPVLNMRKWRHQCRFRMFEDEAPQKVELTGKDGEPLANASISDLVSIIRQTQETAEE